MCKNNRRIWRHRAITSRSRDGIEQLWWRHNAMSEKTVHSNNGEIIDRPCISGIVCSGHNTFFIVINDFSVTLDAICNCFMIIVIVIVIVIVIAFIIIVIIIIITIIITIIIIIINIIIIIIIIIINTIIIIVVLFPLLFSLLLLSLSVITKSPHSWPKNRYPL